MLVSNSLLKKLIEEPETLYRTWLQPKMKFGEEQTNPDKSKREREITAPRYSLKQVQLKLLEELQSKVNLNCLYGSVRGKNNIKNAIYHLHNKYFLTIDLKSFYFNITNKQVHQMLLTNGYSGSKARIISILTTYKGSLPQGAPTSPTISNLVFSPTAMKLNLLCSKHNILFTAFADDLTFSSRGDFKELVPLILETIKIDGFYPHHRKIKYVKNKCEITGLIVNRGQLQLPKEMRDRLNHPAIIRYNKAIQNELTKQIGK